MYEEYIKTQKEIDALELKKEEIRKQIEQELPESVNIVTGKQIGRAHV